MKRREVREVMGRAKEGSMAVAGVVGKRGKRHQGGSMLWGGTWTSQTPPLASRVTPKSTGRFG